MDVATLEIMRADVRARYQWITWTRAGLRLSIPVSPALMARAFKQGLLGIGRSAEGQAGESGVNSGAKNAGESLSGMMRFLAEILGPMSELTMQDNHLIMSFRPDSKGTIRFNFPCEIAGSSDAERPYNASLLKRAEEDGRVLPLLWNAVD